MQFEKIIKIMDEKKIERITGPNVSYTYNTRSKLFFIHSKRGCITYSRKMLEEPLYRDMLIYITTGKLSKELKLLSGMDAPYIHNQNEIKREPGENEYDAILVRGKKRRAYLVKVSRISKMYYARLGPEEIYTTARKGGTIEVYWNKDLIYAGKFDDEALKLAIDMQKQKLIKKRLPFLTEKHIVHAKLDPHSINSGQLEYENRNKHTTTSFFFEPKKQVYIISFVPYREGIYTIRVPADYDGPDPLKFKSIKNVPNEIKMYKKKDYPVKLPKWAKLWNNETTTGFKIDDYTFVFTPWGKTRVFKDNKLIMQTDTQIIEQLLHTLQPDNFILSLLLV